MFSEGQIKIEKSLDRKVIQNPLNNPAVFLDGDLVGAADEGIDYEKDRMEDALAVIFGDGWIAFVDVDGIGGDPQGDIAAQYVVRSFTENVDQNTDPADFHKVTHELMKSEGFTSSGAGYQLAIADLKRMKLKLSPVWDGQLIVIGEDRTIRHRTQRKRSARGKLTQWVAGDGGEPTPIDKPYEEDLFLGDRIICASDFLWDNFTPEEVAKMVAGRSAAEAVQVLNEASKAKVTGGLPNNVADLIENQPTDEAIALIKLLAATGVHPKGIGDNRTLLIWDPQP